MVKRTIVLTTAVLVAGCVEPWPIPEPIPGDQFATEHQDWRVYRRGRLAEPPGSVTWVGLWSIPEGGSTLGADSSRAIILPPGAPEHVGTLTRDGREVRFEPTMAGANLDDGTRITQTTVLKSNRADTATVLAVGSLRLRLHEESGTDRMWLRAWDTEHPATETFELPDYFPLDQSWRVTARYEPYDEPRSVRVFDVTDGTLEYAAPGELVFRVDGDEYRLMAFAGPTSTSFFVILRDATAGSETYGAGRYLRVPFADSTGWTEIDFNRTYNAPCVFTSHSVCALPPPQNRLDLAITAGEKNAAKPATPAPSIGSS